MRGGMFARCVGFISIVWNKPSENISKGKSGVGQLASAHDFILGRMLFCNMIVNFGSNQEKLWQKTFIFDNQQPLVLFPVLLSRATIKRIVLLHPSKFPQQLFLPFFLYIER